MTTLNACGNPTTVLAQFGRVVVDLNIYTHPFRWKAILQVTVVNSFSVYRL